MILNEVETAFVNEKLGMNVKAGQSVRFTREHTSTLAYWECCYEEDGELTPEAEIAEEILNKVARDHHEKVKKAETDGR